MIETKLSSSSFLPFNAESMVNAQKFVALPEYTQLFNILLFILEVIMWKMIFFLHFPLILFDLLNGVSTFLYERNVLNAWFWKSVRFIVRLML